MISLKNYDVLVEYSYVSYKDLVEINKKRVAEGKRKIGFHNLIGYAYREISKLNHNNMFRNVNDNKVLDHIFHHGYNNRAESYLNHKDVFMDVSDDKDLLIGICNGNKVYTSNLVETTKEFSEAAKKYSYDKDANVQRMVLSFSPEATNEMKNKFNIEELLSTTNEMFFEFAKKNGYKPENLHYNISFHTNTKSLHAHIDFFEKVKDRKRGKLSLDAKKELEENMVKYVNDKLKNRSYERIIIDNNYIEKINKSLEEMNLDLFQKLYDCSSKKVGFIKEQELKNELYDYTINFIKESGLKNELDANLYSRIEYYKNIGVDNPEEKGLKHYESECNRIKNDVANLIYKNIKEIKYEPLNNYQEKTEVGEITHNEQDINVNENICGEITHNEQNLNDIDPLYYDYLLKDYENYLLDDDDVRKKEYIVRRNNNVYINDRNKEYEKIKQKFEEKQIENKLKFLLSTYRGSNKFIKSVSRNFTEGYTNEIFK